MAVPWSQSKTVMAFVKAGVADTTINDISRDIMTKQLDLTKFIEELGPALTSTEAEVRAKGTKLLSDVVGQISTAQPDFLSPIQLNFLTTFYIDRMKDHHSVLPAVISGILSMVQMTNFPGNMTQKLLVAMFREINCQSQVRDDRASIFKIYKLLSEAHATELLAMGPDFVYGIINAIDGERDPRNLLFLFGFMPTFVEKYPLHHLSEEMFEIFSCYFPIDFHPSPQDPAAITRDLLASHLSRCLCASEAFADDCIDLILEKIESQLVIAKLDSLELLTMSTTHFPFEKIEEHFEKIWSALKRELLPGSDNAEITAAAFKAVEANVMAASKTSDSKSLEFVLNTIFVAILSDLMDVNSRFFAKSVKLCFVCARTSKTANLYMANKLLPIMLQQLENIDDQVDDNVAKLCIIFETLTDFFAISYKNDILAEINGQQMQAVELKLAKPLEAVVAEKLPPKNAGRLTLLRVSLECLSKICGVLGDEHRTLVYETLKLVLLSEMFVIDVDGVLVVFAKNYPNEVMAMVVQPLIGSDVKNNKLFHALAQLLPLDTFTSTILEFLLKFIVAEAEGRPLQAIALKNLKAVLEDNSSGDFIPELHKRYDLIDKFVTYVQSQKELIEDVLYEISQTMCVIVKALTLVQQQAIVKTHLPKLNLQIVKDLYLASGILGYLDSGVLLEDHFEDLVTDLSTLSMQTEDEVVKQICQQLLCSLFNKMADSEKNKTILKKIIGIFKEEVKKHKHQAVEGLAWIAKALLSRGHAAAAEMVEDLAELLDHPSFKNAAVLAFEIISNEYPQLHLPVIKHLFQQKLFQLMLKLMERKIEKLSEHHLTSIAFIMKMTPHLVLKMNLSKVGPWLLKCLQIDNEKPVLISLLILNRFLGSPPEEFFSNYISDIVQRCLKLCKSEMSMKVRIESLVCLKNLTNFALFLIVPFKQEVVMGLVPCLDDKKRLVRNAAVETRMQWYLAGGESKEK